MFVQTALLRRIVSSSSGLSDHQEVVKDGKKPFYGTDMIAIHQAKMQASDLHVSHILCECVLGAETTARTCKAKPQMPRSMIAIRVTCTTIPNPM